MAVLMLYSGYPFLIVLLENVVLHRLIGTLLSSGLKEQEKSEHV